MKVNTMTDTALQYADSDIRQAIAIGCNTWPMDILVKYLHQLQAVEDEQATRARKRFWRKCMRDHWPIDPLSMGYIGTVRRGVRRYSYYDRDRYRSAMWYLAVTRPKLYQTRN